MQVEFHELPCSEHGTMFSEMCLLGLASRVSPLGLPITVPTCGRGTVTDRGCVTKEEGLHLFEGLRAAVQTLVWGVRVWGSGCFQQLSEHATPPFEGLLGCGLDPGVGVSASTFQGASRTWHDGA